MKDRNADDWEELARREPYFPVLTNEGIREDGFLESGEADIALLLSAIASLLGHEIPLNNVLDFGCGAGRLTLPLARRATQVVGCDIAPTILTHARQNAREAGLINTTFIETSELSRLRDSQFDFICSLLVFQHIRPIDGYKLIRTLLRLLAPGGVAALQLTLEPPGGGFQRLARMHHKSQSAHRVVPYNIRRPSWMQVNAYNEHIVNREIALGGASTVGQFATDGGRAGTVFIIFRRTRPNNGNAFVI